MNLPFDIFVHLLWTILRKTYGILQFLAWVCNGTQTRITTNYRGGVYTGSTQVLNIFVRHKFCKLLQPSGSDNFLMTHKEFVDPEYVLQDHISLYYVNATEAVFVEVEKGMDITQSKYGAFVKISQFNLAKKLIIMPISAFHKLGENVGQTKAKIIFICNTARCGSTLVTQVFEETGTSVAYSEPDAINALTQLKGVVSEAERIRVFKNCINLLCKPCHSKEIKSYILKLLQPAMIEMPMIADLFPDCKALYIYRDGLKCSQSLSKVCKEVHLMALTLSLGRWSGKLTKLVFKLMGLPSDNYDMKLHSGTHFGAIMWVVAMRQYMNFRESDVKIVGVRYEDLVDDTTYAYQKIFEYCDVPYDSKAVEIAMGRDSQRGSLLSMERLSKHKEEKFTDEIKKHTDKLCDQFGLPLFPEPFVAPGTITYRVRD